MKKMITLLAVLGLVLALAPAAQAQWTESANSPFASARPNDKLGDDSGVGISVNIGIIGGALGSTYGSNAGNAYLFDVTTGAKTFELVPTAGAPAANHLYGMGAAISGNLAAVGARRDDQGYGNAGDVYLFNVSTGVEYTAGKLSGTGGFGAAVAISGNTLAIGTENANTVSLYDVTDPAAPSLLGTLTGTPSGNRSKKLALDGNTLVVSGGGAATMYDVTNLGAGGTALVPTGATTGAYGESVDIQGGKVIVGDTGTDAGGFLVGSAYLFDVSAPTAELAQIIPTNTGYRAENGWSVGISGDAVILGARMRYASGTQYGEPGEAHIYDISNLANILATEQTFATGDALSVDDYGRSMVAIDGNVALVGAGKLDTGASDGGGAFIYNLVPEPSSASLLALGGLALLRRRRRA